MAEQLMLIPIPFQRCIAQFKMNSLSSEVDYIFFGYETMFNHLEDAQTTLAKSKSLSAIFLHEAVSVALETLKKYYNKTTSMQFVHVDAMILNPYVKMSVFKLESCTNKDPQKYNDGYRRCCLEDYMPISHHFSEICSSINSGQVMAIKNSSNAMGLDPEYVKHMRKHQKKSNDVSAEFDIYIASLSPIGTINN